jgi:hypothetical protein
MSASHEPLSSGVYTQIAMPAIWLVSLRPGVPLHTDPIDIDLPGMPRGFYTILEGHPRADGGWDVELVPAEFFTWH